MVFARSTDREDLRRVRLRELFLARCPSARTGNDVLTFFLWLHRCSPDLLPPGKLGDSYKLLKVDLGGLYRL